jgi:hypothetical protein
VTTCWSPPANSRYLAQHLYDVRYVELEGTDHQPWVGDNERFFAEVDRFLSSDHPAQSRSARLLQALLATGRALDTSLLGMIERFRGRPATSRSGVIYTFDGAIRAVDCALALMDQQPTLWLSVHAGELEIRAGTISGPAVDAATRGSNRITPWARDGHQRRQGSRPRLQPPPHCRVGTGTPWWRAVAAVPCRQTD